MKRSFADILQGLDSDRAQKVARKLPEWAAVGAEIPTALALEQCSSSATAIYKAGQAAAAANLRFAHPSHASRRGPLPFTKPRVATGLPAAPPDPAEPCLEVLSEAKTPSGVAAECQRDFRKEVEATESPDEVGHAPFIGGSAQRWGFEESERPVRSILDLTGGLGVDSWTFSQVAERVVYFERSGELAEAARRNFERLGAANIEVRCETVTPETELPEADLIYADPARRDAAGRKVFLLEDCTPDILTLLPMLLRKAPTVLLKLSPMADLAMLTDRLGPALREIHVVELDGEVKELLCLLHPNSDPSEPEIVIVRLSGQAAAAADLRFAHPSHASRRGPLPFPEPARREMSPWKGVQGVGEQASLLATGLPAAPPAPEGSLRFQLSEERGAEVQYAAEVRAGDVLLEPCAALLKAGAFRLPCARWGLLKLAPSTHLYLLPGAETPPSAPGKEFFKPWRVKEVLPFGAAAFRQLKQRYTRAEVTARNLPLGSAELQKKIGIAPGGDVHVFACRLADASSILLVTSPAE